MRIRRIAVLMAVAAGLGIMAMPPAVRAEQPMTRQALRIAYQREVAAQRAYQEFAEVADREGRRGVCDLFDALNVCEQVHARLVAVQLERLDEPLVALPTEPEVGTTAANLAAAYETEMQERRVVYVKLGDAARGESQYDAVATFGYARGGELTHARAIAEAYYALADQTADHTYYVCNSCGRLRGEYSMAACECGAMTPRALATRVRTTAPERATPPTGPVAAW